MQIIMEDFVPFEIVLKLKEKGFNEKCLFAYNDEQVINPKIVEEYGDLSDDGYYELTKDGGGKLKFDNVYIYEQQIILRDKIIIERNFIDAPTISQVLKWLREEMDIHIEPCILASVDTDANGNVINEFTYWSFHIVSIVTGDMIYFEYKHIDDRRFDLYEDAAIAGIKYVIENII